MGLQVLANLSHKSICNCEKSLLAASHSELVNVGLLCLLIRLRLSLKRFFLSFQKDL